MQKKKISRPVRTPSSGIVGNIGSIKEDKQENKKTKKNDNAEGKGDKIR